MKHVARYLEENYYEKAKCCSLKLKRKLQVQPQTSCLTNIIHGFAYEIANIRKGQNEC